MVAEAAGISKPLIQIDCGGRFRGYSFRKKWRVVVQVASDLGLDILKPQQLQSISFGKNTTKRTLSAVCPGELISINGTVIGRATEGRVEIEVADGRIIAMKGIQNKQHGLEKLSWVDLEMAIIRSGSIRRSEARPRIEECGASEEQERAQFSSITVQRMPLRQHGGPEWR